MPRFTMISGALLSAAFAFFILIFVLIPSGYPGAGFFILVFCIIGCMALAAIFALIAIFKEKTIIPWIFLGVSFLPTLPLISQYIQNEIYYHKNTSTNEELFAGYEKLTGIRPILILEHKTYRDPEFLLDIAIADSLPCNDTIAGKQLFSMVVKTTEILAQNRALKSQKGKVSEYLLLEYIRVIDIGDSTVVRVSYLSGTNNEYKDGWKIPYYYSKELNCFEISLSDIERNRWKERTAEEYEKIFGYFLRNREMIPYAKISEN